MTVVSVHDLKKLYGSTVAVDEISFKVEQGQIFGLLGPNGAGKTSSLESIEGLRRPDGGSISIMGRDPRHAGRGFKNLIGVQLQSSGLPATMQVGEAMRFFCSYHGVRPRLDLLERLGLAEKQHSQFRQLSTGQQRRLALALAIAHNPPLVLFDEPTAGLDVESRNELHQLMEELREGGTAIILATHDMSEAEKLADRIAILLRGKIAASGTPREITAAGNGLTKVSVRSDRSTLCTNDVSFPGVERLTVADGYAVYFTSDPGRTVVSVLHHLDVSEDPIVDLRVERPSLEERFLEITSETTLNGGRR